MSPDASKAFLTSLGWDESFCSLWASWRMQIRGAKGPPLGMCSFGKSCRALSCGWLGFQYANTLGPASPRSQMWDGQSRFCSHGPPMLSYGSSCLLKGVTKLFLVVSDCQVPLRGLFGFESATKSDCSTLVRQHEGDDSFLLPQKPSNCRHGFCMG